MTNPHHCVCYGTARLSLVSNLSFFLAHMVRSHCLQHTYFAASTKPSFLMNDSIAAMLERTMESTFKLHARFASLVIFEICIIRIVQAFNTCYVSRDVMFF